jgi:acyl-CoA synthetase (AMP-forming)/AMP-acid ligase II
MAMTGLMMDSPLLINSIMQFCKKNHSEAEIVSVTRDNPRHRYTYGDAFDRVGQLANALFRLGEKQGDRIGTLAWNDHRHFEIYYAVSCSGMICHTINPRLFDDQIKYIINDAEDRWLFIDPMFVPLIERLVDDIPGVLGFIVMTDEEHMPETSLRNLYCYETLIAEEPKDFDWPALDENVASSLCYTSGTTGNPKGVMYTHRSTVLHSYASAVPDAFNLSVRDTVLPVVPMFHVNAWGLPYSAAMTGAKLVLPGPKMGDGETLSSLIEGEGVTIAAGVPTILMAILSYLEKSGKTFSTLSRIATGGASCPTSIMRDFEMKHGVMVLHAWGMTETSPLGTFNSLKPSMDELDYEERLKIRAKQGRGVFGIEMKITDDDNRELPWDGKAFGALKVKGAWVCADYFGLEGHSDSHDKDGWMCTGDVATIDSDGFMQITDRTKDVIKSGGEWISSIELENIAMGHPAVAEAAVIGVAHPKWDERPLLVVVKKNGTELSVEEMLHWFDGKIAKWWTPDDVVFVDELPHTATGKLQKTVLRTQFLNYQLPIES